MIKIFKHWLAYEPPTALSAKGWRYFDKEYKEKAPVRYWLHNTLPKSFRPIKWKFIEISNWICYRTVSRLHIINTGLEPGWSSFDDRLFNSAFNMLKDFVEISKAKYSCYGEEAKLLYKKNWKYKIPFYFKYCFREPDLGIKHLLWESSLDDPSLPLDQQSPDQAVLAREVLELYIWWVKDRPSRKNIDVPTYDDQGLVMSVLDSDFDRSAEDYRAFKVVNEQQKLLEENWQEEDDNNFHRLIKIRKLLDT